MISEDYRPAMEGDNAARQRERSRMARMVRVYDMRDEDREGGTHHCFKAEVHAAHDYDDEVWSKPQWANPRSIWKRHCVGVKDETPYPRILQPSEKGVWLTKQDEYGVDNGFPIVRRMILSEDQRPSGEVVHLGVEIWTKPVREYPPMHIGEKSVGLLLSKDEAVAMRDFLTSLLERLEAEDV